MTQLSRSITLVLLLVWFFPGQSAGTTLQSEGRSSAVSSPSSAAAGTNEVIHVHFAKPLDSRKLKEGDEVGAEPATMTEGRNLKTIPLGAMVIGRVTEAKARSRGDQQSSLGIMFEKIRLREIGRAHV